MAGIIPTQPISATANGSIFWLSFSPILPSTPQDYIAQLSLQQTYTDSTGAVTLIGSKVTANWPSFNAAASTSPPLAQAGAAIIAALQAYVTSTRFI